MALLLGSEAFGRTIDENKDTFTRRLRKDVFFNISNRLDSLLTNVNRFKTTTSYVFSLRREEYSELLRGLYRIHTKLNHMARIDGVVAPELPIWGKKGDIDVCHDENDFEILGACFRTEVEHFLIFYDRYYDFVTDTVRGEESQQTRPTETTGTLPSLVTGFRDKPPHMVMDSMSSYDEGTILAQRPQERAQQILGPRRSALYTEGNAMARLKANAAHRQRVTAPTARLRDAMGEQRDQYYDTARDEEITNNLNILATAAGIQTSTPVRYTQEMNRAPEAHQGLIATRSNNGRMTPAAWPEKEPWRAEKYNPRSPRSRTINYDAYDEAREQAYGPYYGGEGGAAVGDIFGERPHAYNSGFGMGQDTSNRSGGGPPNGGGPSNGGGPGRGGPPGGGVPGGGGPSGGARGGGGVPGGGGSGGGPPGGGPPGGGPPGGGPPGGGGPGIFPQGGAAINAREAHFDIKLKIESVPTHRHPRTLDNKDK